MTTIPAFDRAEPAGFIYFRQRNVLVVRHESKLTLETTEYTEAKPLVEATQFAWEAAQTVLKRKDAAALCGKKELLPPEIATETPVNQPENPRLYLCLEDVRFFLTRLSTDGLHEDEEINHGVITDSLIVQGQWVKALRQYQRHAMAMRLWQRSGMDELIHPEPKRPRAKPTMLQEIDLMHELNQQGRYGSHSHAHRCCCGQRQRSHQHGHY